MNKDINSVNNQRNKNSGIAQWLVFQEASLPYKSSIIPDKDIVECLCRVIASVEATVLCSSVKITVSDGQKHRPYLQFKF